MKKSKKLRKKSLLYGSIIGISIGVILIVASIVILFQSGIQLPKKVDGVKIVQTGVTGNSEITEEAAKKAAVKQFKNIGEKVDETRIKVMVVQRQGEEYFYITSPENTMEIKKKGGQVSRVNSVPVEEK